MVTQPTHDSQDSGASKARRACLPDRRPQRLQPGGEAVAVSRVEHSDKGRQLEKLVGPSCLERFIEKVVQPDASAKSFLDNGLWAQYFSGMADNRVSGCSMVVGADAQSEGNVPDALKRKSMA